MLKYLRFIFILLPMSSVYGKEVKESVAVSGTETQKQRIALLIEQKRILDEIAVFQKHIHELKALSKEKQVNLTNNQQEISRKLPLLVRLGRSNPLTLLVDPMTGQHTLRGIILVRALTENLKQQLRQLQVELAELKVITKDIEGQSQAHHKLLQTVENKRAELEVAEREKLDSLKNSELERLANEDDVNTLLDESRNALSKVDKSANAASKAKNLPFRRLERPVSGKIIRDDVIQNKYGPYSIGVIFETRKNAEVLAPSNGTIVFKGPFRDQGEILILDHGKKVHSVFMGMDKINAYVGQKVYAREKLGTMAGYGSGSPKLYFELRQKGIAIDPNPYFAK